MPPKVVIKKVFSEEEDKLAFEAKLVTLVETHPNLWDLQHPDYKIRTTRQNTFELIGAEIGKPGEVCMTLWQNLRTQYLASKRTLPTGSGRNARKSFRLFDAMSFLSGAKGASSTISNLDNDDDTQVGIENGQEELSTINFDDLVDDRSAHATTSSSTNRMSATVSTPAPRSHSKFGGKRKLDPLEEQLLSFVKGGETKVDDDEFENFGRTIASKLRKIYEKDPRAAATCEYKMHGILYDTELDIL